MSSPNISDRGFTTHKVRVLMRNYFSSHHLWAARMFAEKAQEIEDSHDKRTKFDIQHRAFVINTILSSVAFLESAINEIYQDAMDRHSSYIAPLSQKAKECFGAKWKEWFYGSSKRHIPTLTKYLEAMKCCELNPFDKGKQPYQEVALVIKLRNNIIHFTPEDICSEDPHKFGDSLKGYFPENRLMEGGGNPFFPDKCLGAGCALWAVRSVTDFADNFFSQIKIEPPYQRARF